MVVPDRRRDHGRPDRRSRLVEHTRGPIDGWPPSLRATVGIMLRSRFPMFMGWGDELVMFYNDAYITILGGKHPHALGERMDVVWGEVWDVLAPLADGVLAGTAHYGEDLMLVAQRAGFAEETYFTFSYSPIPGDGGTGDPAVAGLFCACSETTGRVLGERRLRILRELGDVSAITAPTVDAAAEASLQVLARGRADVPFASIYLLAADGRTARRAAFYGTLDDPAAVPVALDRDREAAHPLWRVLESGPTVLTGLAGDLAELFTPSGVPMGDAVPDAAVAVPLAATAGGASMGVLVAGASPYRALDTEYRQFLELVAGQVGTAIADAAAHQAQRRRVEELAELDRAKTEFFTGVSHELRTPLTLITGPAEDALSDPADPLSSGQRSRMELIARNSRRLRRLVDTMLDFARLEAGRLVPDQVAVDLAATTRAIGESFAPAVARAGLELRIDCPELPAAVSVDVGMWERIVLNLLSNAVKYTLTGHITLSLRSGAGGGAELQVADTGIGIDAADQPLLFSRFQRVRGAAGRSGEGSGIGLALVAELAELHDGHASVHSVPGVGSTFTVSLPAAAFTDAPARAARASAAVGLYREEALQWTDPDQDLAATAGHDSGATAGATVLVVEDNSELRRFLAELLAPHYRVLLAADGRAALALARAELPDLVLSDVMMPGLDGFALLAELRADPGTATTPVVLLSAGAGAEAAAEGLAAGADDYLVKPFSSHDLLARVRSNLAMARLRSREGAWRAALVDALQDGLCVLDADNSVIEVNEAFTEVLGYGPDGLPYPVPHPWWPDPDADPEGVSQVVEAMTAVRTAGTGRYALRLRHRDGHRLWVECSASTVLEPGGDAPMTVAVLRDVTAAHRSAERDRLLADTGRLLNGAAPLVERLTAFAELAAPVLADLAVVSLAGPDGRLVPVAAAHRDRREVAEAALGRAPQAVPATLFDAYRAGRAFALEPCGTPGSLIAPLAVPGRLLGALSFVSTDGPRAHDELDLALADELGRRLTGLVEADRIAIREQQLHAITTALAAAGSVTEAAAVLGDGVRTALGATGIAVYVTQPEDPQQLRLAHSSGYPPEVAETFALVHVGAALPVSDAVRSGAPLWLGENHSWQTRYPHMAVPGAAEEAYALAALPLRVDGRVVGVLAASFPTERAFPPDERSFALTMTGQAAQAFDRAATADARWQIAQTLQRSLLPARLPSLSRLALAAHYLPAGRHTAAGGDWYDVTVLDPDHVAIAVGDVVGHGSHAAAVMGQLRSALSAYLLESHAPAHALQWLNRFARGVEGARGSTAICLVLHTGTGELRWARAGHPPPLILDPAASGAHYLDDAHGAVLGLTGAPPITEGHAVLTPGCTVLLYTDGLVERRGEIIDDGLDRLAAGASAHLAPDRLVPTVLHRFLHEGRPADDVAVIAARLRPGPFEQRLPARPAELPRLRRTVARWAAAAALPDELLDDLQLALGEAVANAVEHAYPGGAAGQFGYRLAQAADGAVQVQVRDDGTWRPPSPTPVTAAAVSA